MRSTLRSLGFAAVGFIAGGLLLACHGKYLGGGWVASAADPNEKATFGFQMRVEDLDNDGCADVATGQFQYDDKNAAVRFHAVVDSADVPCGGVGGIGVTWTFFGNYVPQPKRTGAGGTFVLTFVDDGDQGPTVGDFISVQLFGGVYDGYSNAQFVSGIQGKFVVPD